MKRLATILRTLANIAESSDCDRPEQAIDILLSTHTDSEEITRLHSELDTMKRVIGDLSLRIRDIENKNDDARPKTHTVIKMQKR